MTSALRRCDNCPTLAMAAHVVSVEDLCPTLRRITLGGPELMHFGVDGPTLDLRLKLVLPNAGATPRTVLDSLADIRPLADAGEDTGWYRSWLAKPEFERGAIRTYTARELRHTPSGTELVIDFVLHVDVSNGRPEGGPATVWAASAAPGSPVAVIGPNRAIRGNDYGGIEWRPGTARRILLAGDETAVPAITGILTHLSTRPDAHEWSGQALLEVPLRGDRLDITAPDGVEVTWLPREGAPRGTLLTGAVADAAPPATRVPWHPLDEVDAEDTILWETSPHNPAERYAWVAGEAGMLKQLRRWLLGPAGLTKEQVAIMGYWREGRAS
ncbi:siderophore-interacting protein [Tessaracoccus antarcticus]|uniref:Siderophore-interacting protein n=1 Tax=Tessaracoccus antarcticus TaxID=2479848 RepID=A0A3M0G220_9ACTN|nr:siderophore-interacting protein [Tessaracoccus antarcticus]RMB58167.1 siderophore-interacting protein [Tessaracoccus antarcticus]